MSDARTGPKLYRPKDAEKLKVLHPDLVRVVEAFGATGAKFLITETQRGREAQEKARSSGHSNAHFGQSPHNYQPALGIDLGAVPYPGALSDYEKLRDGMFAAAKKLDIHLVWGGDWHSLKDFPHFELANWKIIAKHEKLAD